MLATLQRVEDVTASTKTFWFKPAGRFRYVAGEFTELYLPHEVADTRGDKRWFSLSSSPTQPLVSITSKFAPTNGSSFKQALLSLRPGQTVQLAEPMGDFVLPKDTTIPIVFIAWGVGITPVYSIAQWVQATQDERVMTIIHQARGMTDMPFRAYFETCYAASYRATTDAILPHLPAPTPATLYYLAGAEDKAKALKQQLEGLGIASGSIVTDYFPGYPA